MNRLGRFGWISALGLVAIIALLVCAGCTKKGCEWMQTHIQKELSPVSRITTQQLDLTQKMLTDTNTQFMRVKTIEGRLSYQTLPLVTPNCEDRVRGFVELFKRLEEAYGLPDLDLIIVLEDGMIHDLSAEDLAPVFCISKLKTQNKVFSIPEIHLYPSLDKLYTKITKAGLRFDWKKKAEIGFWRGSTTGGHYAPEDWMHTFRSKFVLFSKTLPQLLDCAFSNFVQGTSEAEAVMRSQGLFQKNCSGVSQVKYKYLIAVDGNTFPSSLKWQLFSGSVVMRNQSDWVEWFDGGLVPFQHYVPFESDFSDLEEKLSWLKKNDLKAKQITKEALKFAKTNLTCKGIELYVHKLMIAYSQLQRNDL